MSTKVRKQIYLEQRQNRQLKRLAEARGVSEAEVVRELIDSEAAGSAAKPLPPDQAAWEAILAFSQQRAKSGVTGNAYHWTRDEIYEERLSRFGPRGPDTAEAEHFTSQKIAASNGQGQETPTHDLATTRRGEVGQPCLWR